VFGDTSGDSERARRLEAEAETDRELSEGAPAHQSWFERWRASRRRRPDQAAPAKPPADDQGGGPSGDA
jgi:predicted phage gp36 major capsid-like protein